MKIKTLVVIFVSMLISGSVFAQEKEFSNQLNEYKGYTHQLGLSISTISGGGFHYLFFLGDSFGIKLTGIYLYDEDNKKDNKTREDIDQTGIDGNIGLEFQKDIHQNFINHNISMRFYLFAGGSLWYEKDTEEYVVSGIEEDTKHEKYYTIGGGLGYEIMFWQSVTLGVHVGYQYKDYLTPNDKKYFGFGGGASAGIVF